MNRMTVSLSVRVVIPKSTAVRVTTRRTSTATTGVGLTVAGVDLALMVAVAVQTVVTAKLPTRSRLTIGAAPMGVTPPTTTDRKRAKLATTGPTVLAVLPISLLAVRPISLVVVRRAAQEVRVRAAAVRQEAQAVRVREARALTALVMGAPARAVQYPRVTRRLRGAKCEALAVAVRWEAQAAARALEVPCPVIPLGRAALHLAAALRRHLRQHLPLPPSRAVNRVTAAAAMSPASLSPLTD